MSFAMHAIDTRRALSSLRESIRRRRIERTDRRHVAREIAAYPATRSAALAVLPARRHEAA
jgi:hypothetical protein